MARELAPSLKPPWRIFFERSQSQDGELGVICKALLNSGPKDAPPARWRHERKHTGDGDWGSRQMSRTSNCEVARDQLGILEEE